MNILHKLTATFALATTPLAITGCDKKDPPKEYKEIALEVGPVEVFDVGMERKKIPFPLKNIREFIPGIHKFDRNKNEMLEPEEIDLLIKILVNNGKDEYIEEGKVKLEKIIEAIRNNAVYIIRKDYRCTPNNIEQTLSNFDAALKQYESKLKEIREKALDETDRQVETKIQNLLKGKKN